MHQPAPRPTGYHLSPSTVTNKPKTQKKTQVGLHNLVKAFHSARTAPYVKLKLAKRGGQPCICLEARVRVCVRVCVRACVREWVETGA
jgi:hypothetical protein